MQIRGTWQAQVTDVHPEQYELSIILPHLANFEGVRVAIASDRAHPVAGTFQMPEKGDWGLVVFPYSDARGGIWLCSIPDRNRNMIPTEVLAIDPHAVLRHYPSDHYVLEHGDSTTENVYPDGSFWKATTTKDGTKGNSGNRAALTERKYSSNGKLGEKGQRKGYSPRVQPPIDYVFSHSSGAMMTLTADGSFLFTTPKGHTVKLHDGTEKVRSPDDGSVTGTPEEDEKRISSELVIQTETGLSITMHDDPEQAQHQRYMQLKHPQGHIVDIFTDPGVDVDHHIKITHAKGHEVLLMDDPVPQANSFVEVKTAGGHLFHMRDKIDADIHAKISTPAGHLLELRDTPIIKATISTPGGRSVVMDDIAAKTTITDPAKIEVFAPDVQLGGAGGPGVARFGDTVLVGGVAGTITSASTIVKAT
jgi:hypothetical protein